jgi:hypothetical protein
MVDQEFDVTLSAAYEANWVMIPRRNRLDADNSCI